MLVSLIVPLAQLLAVLVAIVAVWVTLKGIRDQLWLTTFSDYTKRYSDIMERIPFDARDPHAPFDLDKFPTGERHSVLTAVRNYLNLCSEEFYLNDIGRLDDRTWTIWKAGIRDTMRTRCFIRAWDILKPEYDAYPMFQDFMDAAKGDA